MPAFEAPVYTLKGIKIRFGSKQLFEDVELYINRGDKISLVGRNGSGKSTLLKIIAGIIEPDDGEIFIQPNVKIGYMPQDADLSGFKTLREAVAAGLDKHDGSEDYKTDMWIEQLEIAADADPATGLTPLGDMVISLERARAQGEEYGHGTRREAAYLTVHSVLHLLGYDHMDEGPEKARMRAREEAILGELGITREDPV